MDLWHESYGRMSPIERAELAAQARELQTIYNFVTEEPDELTGEDEDDA